MFLFSPNHVHFSRLPRAEIFATSVSFSLYQSLDRSGSEETDISRNDHIFLTDLFWTSQRNRSLFSSSFEDILFSIFYGKAPVSPRSFPLYCMYTSSFFPSDQQPWSNRIAHSFFPLRLFGWWNGSERTFATVLSRDWQNNVAFLSSPFHCLALCCMWFFFSRTQ